MRKNNIIAVFVMILLLISLSYAKSSIVYSLTLNYDGTTLTEDGLRLIEGTAPERLNQPENGFTLKVVDFNGNTLHSFKFLIETSPIREPPSNIFDENGTQITVPQDTIPAPQQTQIVLVVPYFENAKSIQIYDENNALKTSVDVSKYSQQVTGIDPLYIVGTVGLLVIIFLAVVFFMKKRQKSSGEAKRKTSRKRRKRK